MEDKFECWLPSWDVLHQACKSVAKRMKEDGFKPDIVIALARGGFFPARMICDFLIIKDLVSVKIDHWGITASKDGKARLRYPINIDLTGKNALIVDDITDTGDSMMLAVDFFKKMNPKQLRTAAIYHIKTSKFKPDYYGEEIDWKWVMWPWNYVEDMCNITPKVLDEKKAKKISDIRNELKGRFKIDVTEDSVQEILDELKSRDVASESSGGWLKNKTN